MLFLKVLLSIVSFGFLAGAIGTVAYDIYLAFQLDRILRRNERAPKSESGDVTDAGTSSSSASSNSPSLAQPISRPPISAPRRRIRWVIAAKLLRLLLSRRLRARALSSCLTGTRACA